MNKKTKQFDISLFDFNQLWLQYSIEYTYESDRSNCECDSICRCSKIIDQKIVSIDINSLVNKVANRLDKKRKEDLYFIERILVINKVYIKDNWEIEIGNGYYGQEVREINIDISINQSINNNIIEFFKLQTLKEKIEYILNLEYGYLLEDCKDKVWTLETAKYDDVIFGQKDHYIKLDMSVVETYKNRELPIGISLFSMGKYRLIDGYHRGLAAQGKETVELFVGS